MILSGFDEKKGKVISNLNLKSFISDYVSDFSSCTELQSLVRENENKENKKKNAFLNLSDGKLGIFAFGDSALIAGYGLWDGAKLHDRLMVFDFDSETGKLTPAFTALASPDMSNPSSARKCSMMMRSLVKQLSAYLFRNDAKDFIIEALEKIVKK